MGRCRRRRSFLDSSKTFDLPAVSPKNKRPINPAKVEWTNLGEHGISHAEVSAEVTMPNGESKTEKFKVPLNYYQEKHGRPKEEGEKGSHSSSLYSRRD